MRVHAVCNSIAITASEPGGISRCVEWKSKGGAGQGEQRQTQRQQKRSKLKQQRATTITTRGGRNAPKAQLEKQSTKQRFEFRSKRFHRHLLLTRWRSRYTMDLHCTGPVLQSPCHTPAPLVPVVAGTATEVECNQCLERLPRATECATLLTMPSPRAC